MGILNILFAQIKTTLRLFITITGVIPLLLISLSLHSAPSQKPLFLQQRVKPNIMLLLDNSSSMDKEVLHYREGNCAYKCYLDFTPDYIDIHGHKVKDKANRLRLCPGFNSLMFDPSKTYTPWRGKDKNNQPFQNSKVDKAQENPYLASSASCTAGIGDVGENTSTGVCDLTTDMGPDGKGAYYYPWVDDNNNQKYDEGECKIDNSDRVWVSQMSAKQQQNFANWFSYYRKRDYVMKRALSEIISESQERIGMAVINLNWKQYTQTLSNEQFGVEVSDMDVTKNKSQLLENLFRTEANGLGTFLREALVNVGHYFEAGNNIGTDLFGFTPVNGSPILSASKGGECQQNFVITLSDGHWNGPSPSIGNTDTNSNNAYDGQSYADDYSDTLADVAMHYYKRDLSPLPNKVPAPSIFPGKSKDDNPAQHLVTYTVAFGLSGTIQNSDGTPCYPGNREDSVKTQGWPEICADPLYNGQGSGWPEPKRNKSTIDDMLHAAWNGRGQFLSATKPQELITKLQTAISDITVRTGATPAATAVTVNSTNMRSGGYIYQAGFDSKNWAGKLSAYEFIGNKLSSKPKWEAHKLLSKRTASRVMITYNGTTGVPFEFPDDYQDLNPQSDLHPDQVKDLLTNAPYDTDTHREDEILANKLFGEALVAYLHGSNNEERGNISSNYNFRPRNNDLLADIIHSAPVYVGTPNPANYPDAIETTSYRLWANATSKNNNIFRVSQRQPMIYVGTNGGGLHGFNANTGKEVFVYIPKALFSDEAKAGLHWLADPSYNHHYYADQTPAVGNVFIKDKWKTLLVSGLRGGGKALFALDITNPNALANQAIAAKKVLWEFTNKNLGYTFGQPTLAKLNNGNWAAIFGNGYNNAPNGDGKARLFIVNLSDGTLIRSIDTGIGSIKHKDCADETSQCNGLSTPAVVDLDGDGIADRAYAGDLAGNLWVFDLSSTTATKWSKSLLFKAEYGIDSPQPITTRPAVTIHPHQSGLTTKPNTMVLFGTGQYINKEDIDNTTTQSFYGIWDNGHTVANGRSALVEQTISEGATLINNVSHKVRTMSSNPVNYSTEQRGWYVDFKTSKERVIVNPVLFGQLVIFTTTIPDQNLCGIAGGSWLMVLDSDTGGEPRFTALDISNDGVLSDLDMVEGHNISGLRSGDLYWQPSIIQTGSGNSGTILLPKDNESNTSGTNGKTLDQINIQGALSSKARSSWSHFNFQ